MKKTQIKSLNEFMAAAESRSAQGLGNFFGARVLNYYIYIYIYIHINIHNDSIKYEELFSAVPRD